MSTLSAELREASGPVEPDDYLQAVTHLEGGNKEGFADFCELIRPRLMNYFRFKGFQIHDAEDLTQETLLAFFENTAELRKKNDNDLIEGWVYTVACNKSGTFRRTKRMTPLDDTAELLPDKKPTPPETTQNKDIWKQAASIGRYGTAINLRYVDGMTYEEIAHELKMPRATVATWIHRGHGQLREILEPPRCA